MILYFSGSGNSRFVAEALQDRLGDKIVSLNDIIKNNKETVFYSDTPFIIVSPIYAWRLPRIVEQTISNCEFSGSLKVYFVVTMGENSGTTDVACKKICQSKGWEFMGFRGIKMPDNYVFYGKMPSKTEIEEKINKAVPQIDSIALSIKSSIKISKDDKTPFASLLSGVINNIFYIYFVTDKKYNVNQSCTGCGRCEVICPVNNIKVENLKPTFLHKCISCYACIHNCPTKAINIGQKTIDHGRYVCPPYTDKYKKKQ